MNINDEFCCYFSKRLNKCLNISNIFNEIYVWKCGSNNTQLCNENISNLLSILSIDVFVYVLVILCYFFTAFVFMTLNHRFSYLTLSVTEEIMYC